MKRLVIACGCLIMLVAIGLMVWMRSDVNPAVDAQEEAVRTETQNLAATPPPPDGPSDPAPAADGSENTKELRLPPDTDVQRIVKIIEMMAASGTPAFKVHARELSLVLRKYNVELPQVLSDLITAKLEPVQPDAAEIAEVGKWSVRVAGFCQIQSQYKTDPAVVQAFYVDLLLAVASTSPSKQARMRAAHVILKGASPPTDTVWKPRRSVNPEVARRAIAQALYFTLDPGEGDSGNDLLSALMGWRIGNVSWGYLTVSMMAEPENKSESVDALVLPLISRAEELAKVELPAASRKQLEAVLENSRKHLGRTGSFYTARVDRRSEIEAFFDQVAEAVNKEDKQALAKLMPPGVVDKMAAVEPLRDAWSGMPGTQRVEISVVGPTTQVGEQVWRVMIYIRPVVEGNANQTNARVVEYLLERGAQGYRIPERH